MPLTPDPGRLRPSLQASSLYQRLFVGNAATLGATLRAWHWANWLPRNVHERLAVTSEMLTLAERQRDDEV